MSKPTASELYAFQTITDFVSSLADMFGGEKHHHTKALLLYNRLISKTQINDKPVIQKHLSAFRSFCNKNRENLKEHRELNPKKIVFSERIYIHVGFFMKKADVDTQKTILEYILTLSALLDPMSQAKELLQQLRESSSDESSSQQPDLGSMMSQMAPMMNQMLSNPAMSSMLSSMMGGNGLAGGAGEIPDLTGIDFQKLTGSMNKVMGTVVKTLEESNDPEIKNLLNFANNLQPKSENEEPEEAPLQLAPAPENPDIVIEESED